MKYTVSGLRQDKLIELGLDCRDALVIQWFAEFMATGKMKIVNHDEKYYYWVNYAWIITQLPILGVDSHKSIARMFKKYVDVGLMEQYIYKNVNVGTLTYYRFTEKYMELIYSKPDEIELPDKTAEGNHTLDSPVLCNSIINDSSTNESLSKDKDVYSAKSDQSKQKKKSSNEMKSLFESFITEWNDLTGECQIPTDDKMYKYFCGKITKHGHIDVFNAMRNYAKDEWNREKQAWVLMKMFTDSSFIGKWATKKKQKKMLQNQAQVDRFVKWAMEDKNETL